MITLPNNNFGALRVLHNPQSALRNTPYGQLASRIISRQCFELAMNEISKWSGYKATPLLSLAGLAKKNGAIQCDGCDPGKCRVAFAVVVLFSPQSRV